MLTSDHVIELENIAWYQAPTHRIITPGTIKPNCERIELITSGFVYFDNGNGAKAYGAGAMFWHLVGERTVHHPEPSDPYQCMSFKFITKTSLPRQVPRLTFWESPADVTSFGREVFRIFHNPDYDQQFAARYLYTRLLWQAHSYTVTSPASNLPSSLIRVLRTIEERLGEDLLVADLAEAGGLSSSHLHALFREHFSVSPHQYLLRCRIQEAKTLLARPGLSVKEVATRCGFASSENFCRTFKREMNLTPGQFQKKHTPKHLQKH